VNKATRHRHKTEARRGNMMRSEQVTPGLQERRRKRDGELILIPLQGPRKLEYQAQESWSYEVYKLTFVQFCGILDGFCQGASEEPWLAVQQTISIGYE
jgi:hypothetical protein